MVTEIPWCLVILVCWCGFGWKCGLAWVCCGLNSRFMRWEYDGVFEHNVRFEERICAIYLCQDPTCYCQLFGLVFSCQTRVFAASFLALHFWVLGSHNSKCTNCELRSTLHFSSAKSPYKSQTTLLNPWWLRNRGRWKCFYTPSLGNLWTWEAVLWFFLSNQILFDDEATVLCARGMTVDCGGI